MHLAPAHIRHELQLEIRADEHGEVLAVERVTAADLADARSELWFRERLRKGQPAVPMECLVPELRPVLHKAGGTRCLGFALSLQSGQGPAAALVFPRSLLEPAAMRAAQRLVAEGRLATGATYTYDLHAHEAHEGGPSAGCLTPGVRLLAVAEPEPLEVRQRSLAPLLSAARFVPAPATARAAVAATASSSTAASAAESGPGDHVVFMTERAFARAERSSRRGALQAPPVESGALLVGTLCSCPESGEMFALVDDALDAVHAEQSAYALSFSAATWHQVSRSLEDRRAAPGGLGLRLLGSAHGHNFLPADGAPPCDACEHTEVCTRTSAVLSLDDEVWSRAVFHAQPWQLALVFGLSARGDAVHTLYGQHRGRLCERGFHLIPEDLAGVASRP